MNIYRRHVPPCTSTDRRDPRCGCPIHYSHYVNGKQIRKALHTTNWQKALADIRRKELEGFQEKPKSPAIEQACERYLEDARARDLKDPTLYKFRLLFRQLQDFAKAEGLVYVSDFNLDYLRRFRASWPNKNESARVKLGNLKSFTGFCHKSKWLLENHAEYLKAAKVTEQKIIPLEPDEIARMLEVCDKYKLRSRGLILKALILILRFTGLRIRDAVTLSRDSVQGNRLFLRTAKTGVDVFCPLPPNAVAALAALPTKSRWYFWNGVSKPKSVVGVYQKQLAKVFKTAGVPRAYPHLFRHTLATDLLLKGVAVVTVATILGNTAKMVERRYFHFIKAHQDNLEMEVKKSWTQTSTNAD